MTNTNDFAHRMLTDQGAATHAYYPASWEDDGDAENGPRLTGGPAYDEYLTESHFIHVVNGIIIDMNVIDWKWVEFCEMMENENA